MFKTFNKILTIQNKIFKQFYELFKTFNLSKFKEPQNKLFNPLKNVSSKFFLSFFISCRKSKKSKFSRKVYQQLEKIFFFSHISTLLVVSVYLFFFSLSLFERYHTYFVVAIILNKYFKVLLYFNSKMSLRYTPHSTCAF